MVDKVLLHGRCLALQLQREQSPPPFQRTRHNTLQNGHQPHNTAPPPSTLPPKPPLQSSQCTKPPHKGSLPHSQQPPRRSKLFQFQYGSLNRRHVNREPPSQHLLGSHPLSKSTDVLNSDNFEYTARPKTILPLHRNEHKGSSPVELKSTVSPSSVDKESPSKGVSSPPFGNSSASSGTPTPTNPVVPIPIPSTSPNRNLQAQAPLNSYQEGFLLFQSWVCANAACVWDTELVKAVRSAHFVGNLVGGFLLIGGTPRVLAAICHAHSRALLSPPPGWNILLLGEINDCEVSVVTRGQFTPLGDALCWVIHRLTNLGIATEQDGLRNALLVHFPSMTPPDPALVHATLSDLIRQRKVFHTARGYGIVQPDTYVPVPAAASPEQEKPPPPRLLTTSEALTKAHGLEERVKDGRVCHAAVQTDLADLLSGAWPESTILIPRSQSVSSSHFDPVWQRTGSFRNTQRRIAVLSPEDDGSGKPKVRQYEGFDMTDVTHRAGDKASVLSKLLRVSQPRRRLASFSGQFPPPEWSNSSPHVKHLHSVATQTRSSKHPGGPESCWVRNGLWAPRSSTLPRRPPKPLSTSPILQEGFYHRPHSASPSHSKMIQDSSTSSSTQPQSCRTPQKFSSSPSPSGTPSHSSRNPSPSLQSSSATPSEAGGSRVYYHRSVSPSYTLKRGSPTPPYTSQTRSHSASPSKVPIGHRQSSQTAIYHNLPKDPRRKPLSSAYQSRNFEETAISDKEEAVHRVSSSKVYGRQTNSSRQTSSANTIEGSPRRRLQQKQDQGSHISREEVQEKHENKKWNTNDRSSLQLDLSTVHMNNSRKIVSSPTKPDGLKKVFHENLTNLVKGSVSDLTSKNLGYIDVNKCDKKLCVIGSSMIELDSVKNSKDMEDEDSKSMLSKSSPALDEKHSKKVFKPVKLSFSIAPDNSEDLKKGIELEKPLSPDEESHSVKTYPSLSELNLNFSSLTAQKILQGVSVNSLDTLVEVNMLADKSLKEGVTNTNFGFV